MSRTQTLKALAIGQSAWFKARPGKAQNLAQQIGIDAKRAGVVISRQQIIGIHPDTRALFDLVRVIRTA